MLSYYMYLCFFFFFKKKKQTVKDSLCGGSTVFKSALYIVDAAANKTLNYECNNKKDREGCGSDQAEVVARLTKNTEYFFVVVRTDIESNCQLFFQLKRHTCTACNIDNCFLRQFS